MDIIEFREYCIKKALVTESFPFDNQTLVFKVGGKMFALCNVDNFQSVNLKCDPQKAIELREQFSEVKPGYHMSKKHWNTVSVEGSISSKLLKQWIDDSYDLIFSSLPAKIRNQVNS